MEVPRHRHLGLNFNVTLASTLLDVEESYTQYPLASVEKRVSPRQGAANNGTRVRTGVESLDRGLPGELWKGGKVLGLGACLDDHGVEHDDEAVTLISKIVATHLVDNYRARIQAGQDDGNTTTSVFLLAPPDSELVTTIYHVVLSQLKAEGRAWLSSRFDGRHADHDLENIALSLLEKVSILPYLDLIGLSEVVSEVSTAMSSVAATAAIDDHGQEPASIHSNSILVVQGLPLTLAKVVHRSNAYSAGSGMLLSQTAALLTGILRNLRVLSRTRISNQKSGVQQGMGTSVILETHIVRTDLSPAARSTEYNERNLLRGGGEVLDTSFADSLGRIIRVSLPVTTVNTTGGPIRSSATNTMTMTLSRILADSMEVVVLVHDAFRKDYGIQEGHATGGSDTRAKVVEIVKDVHGFHLGLWAVWKTEL